MAELKKPVSGKDAAANDDTNKPEAIDRNVTGAELLLDNARFDSDRLVGDVGDFLLKDLRTTHELKPWSKMTEKQQNALIDRAEKQATHIVAAVVRAIASRGIEYMEGTLADKGSFGDGFFTLKIDVPMNEKNTLLLAKREGEVQIVFSSPQKFQSTMMVRAEPDAPSLIPPKPDEATAMGADAETGKNKKKKDKPEEAAPAAAPSV
jgi:hypothetical protein